MPRKMVIVAGDGSTPVLAEVEAHDEQQLQARLTENPDLIPIEEWGWSGPLMVVGRETSLPSGAPDLVAIARSGEVLVAEFKTGPCESRLPGPEGGDTQGHNEFVLTPRRATSSQDPGNQSLGRLGELLREPSPGTRAGRWPCSPRPSALTSTSPTRTCRGCDPPTTTATAWVRRYVGKDTNPHL